MRQALTWYAYGFLLLFWLLTLAREFNLIAAAAYPLGRVAGLAVLGALPFFALALTVALWPRRARVALPADQHAEEPGLAAD